MFNSNYPEIKASFKNMFNVLLQCGEALIFRLLDVTSFKFQICTAWPTSVRDIRFLTLGSHVTDLLVSQPYSQHNFGPRLGLV